MQVILYKHFLLLSKMLNLIIYKNILEILLQNPYNKIANPQNDNLHLEHFPSVVTRTSLDNSQVSIILFI